MHCEWTGWAIGIVAFMLLCFTVVACAVFSFFEDWYWGKRDGNKMNTEYD